MDKVIMGLMLLACAGLTAAALRMSDPRKVEQAKGAGEPVMQHANNGAAAPQTPPAPSEVNAGAFGETEHTHADHSDHTDHTAAAADEPASTQAFRLANATMHRDMGIVFTGDADADFVRGMIPHHQGAVDMAKIVLQHGKDPEIRKLAEAVVAAQETEIKMMREWLAKTGK